MENLDLEIFNEPDSNSPAYAYLMADGKLYLNKAAMKILKSETIHVNIAKNKANNEDNNIYLIESNDKDKNSKQINKAGYISTQNFIKNMNIDPIINSFVYKFTEGEYNGKRMFILEFIGSRNRKKKSRF